LECLPLAALGFVHAVQREVEAGTRLDRARPRLVRLALALREKIRGLKRRNPSATGTLLLLRGRLLRRFSGRQIVLRFRSETARGAHTIAVRGLTLVPALIDADVHLSVAGVPASVARAQVKGGVAAVLDLGAPERTLPLDHPPLRVGFSGPLMTAPGGYPTRSWGKNGEGLELATAADARAAVLRLSQRGARFIKLAFD